MLRTYKGIAPAVAPSAYVDDSAHIGDESSVWVNAVVRGDVNLIRIGRRTNIQDGVVVHVMREPSHPTLLGDDITVGHGAVVHGCTIEHACLIGMGAILLNGSHVGAGSIVAAGALLPEGCVIPPRSLVMGAPGKVKRPTTDAEYAFILESAQNYVRYRLDYL